MQAAGGVIVAVRKLISVCRGADAPQRLSGSLGDAPVSFRQAMGFKVACVDVSQDRGPADTQEPRYLTGG